MSQVDDDPIMVKIRQDAELIRFFAGYVVSLGDEPWSKAQLASMLEEAADASDRILKLTGIDDVEGHMDHVNFDLEEQRSAGIGIQYVAFADV